MTMDRLLAERNDQVVKSEINPNRAQDSLDIHLNLFRPPIYLSLTTHESLSLSFQTVPVLSDSTSTFWQHGQFADVS